MTPNSNALARPATPPLSSPSSPTNSRMVLRTPLKLSRSRHPNFVPATPQSLREYGTPLSSKQRAHDSPLTPCRNPSDWHVREDSPSGDSDTQDQRRTAEPVTPNKHFGLFTPQVTKRTRNPLLCDITNNSVSQKHQLRGSLTDPPPRRRAERPCTSDKHILDPKPMQLLDTGFSSPPTHEPDSPPISRRSTYYGCASCGSTERLSVLQPCQHEICASCVNGSLNVVGEKSMACMYCHSPAHSFVITGPEPRIYPGLSTQHTGYLRPHHLNLSNDTKYQPIQLSRPPLYAQHESMPYTSVEPGSDTVVLRIDNVPWDTTPFMLEHWLNVPIVQCHVLLDRTDGRTLNYAYVETTAEGARFALKSRQNKILGQGRRMRPVTLTLSGQEHLMHDLFPSWTGEFKGIDAIYEKPLAGPQTPLPNEFLSVPELQFMLHLIQSPKSHFLKVPCLAYWSLLSTLLKFPARDVFAPSLAPDILFDITIYALEKYETFVGGREYDCTLHTKLIAGALRCRAFTDRQLRLLLRFTNQPLPAIQQNSYPSPNLPTTAQGSHFQHYLPFSSNPIQYSQREGVVQLPMPPGPYMTADPRDRVAQDFGIDPALVHALAERLTLHSSSVRTPSGLL